MALEACVPQSVLRRAILTLTAQVRAASHIKTNEPVAIKIISRARMQEEKGAEDKGELWGP